MAKKRTNGRRASFPSAKIENGIELSVSQECVTFDNVGGIGLSVGLSARFTMSRADFNKLVRWYEGNE